MTPFARFLLFMIFFVPVVFVGASYYNGEDPVATVKGWLGTEERAPEVVSSTKPSSNSDAPATFENVADMRAELKQLRRDLAVTREQLERCKLSNE